MTQILRGLSGGLSNIARGVATASEDWPEASIASARLAAAEKEQKRKAAQNLFQLALKSNNPDMMTEALELMKERGGLPDVEITPEIVKSVTAKKTVAPKPMPGVAGVFYEPDMEGGLKTTETSYYQEPVIEEEPTASNYLDEAIEIARSKGYEAGKGYLEGKLLRPLTKEEIKFVQPTLTMDTPALDETDLYYEHLMTIPDLNQRREEADALSPADYKDLMGRYGAELNLPARIDPIIKRKAIEVTVPLLKARNIKRLLKNPDLRDKMGPLVHIAWFMNPFDETTKLFIGESKIATQIVGRFLEGGVLRSQFDEEKYQGIMPQPGDHPPVADVKINSVIHLLETMHELYSKGGVLKEQVNQEGKVVTAMTLPDLPWNPADPNLPINEISQWLSANPDYEYGQELLRIYKIRLRLTEEVNRLQQQPEETQPQGTP